MIGNNNGCFYIVIYFNAWQMLIFFNVIFHLSFPGFQSSPCPTGDGIHRRIHLQRNPDQTGRKKSGRKRVQVRHHHLGHRIQRSRVLQGFHCHRKRRKSLGPRMEGRTKALSRNCLCKKIITKCFLNRLSNKFLRQLRDF